VTKAGEPVPAPQGDDPARAVPRRVVGSVELFQGHGELIILHRNEEYRLRITRAGKLILTK
jgi:hemin uptake protein HemP